MWEVLHVDRCVWFVLLIVLGLTGLAYAGLWRSQPQAKSGTNRATIQRQLKPRSPDDCPACRRPSAPMAQRLSDTPPSVLATGEESPGAPKRISTDGYACPRPRCDYYRVTDAHVHALVGDGQHGKMERI